MLFVELFWLVACLTSQKYASVFQGRIFSTVYCLVGLVVKACASRAEDPGFESHLRQDFSGVESCQ